MNTTWEPFREPLRKTLLRTVAIALIAGAGAAASRGELARWPVAALLMLWPSFGGHWVEVWFLNWLRPRLPAARPVQIGARLATWFVGGVLLLCGMRLTALALGGFGPAWWPAWWVGGPAFIVIELLAQFRLQVGGKPSFYNGRG